MNTATWKNLFFRNGLGDVLLKNVQQKVVPLQRRGRCNRS